MSLESYCEKFGRLKVNLSSGRASPHKICMLLSVLDLARSGALVENRIYYAPPLLERFARYFDAVRADGDYSHPYFPFFHLAGSLKGGGSSFWHLQPKPGRETVLEAMSTARKASDVTDNILFAYLDSELFALLSFEESIDALGEALSNAWFDRGLEDLRSVVEQLSEVSRYEHRLRDGPREPVLRSQAALPPAYIRDPAFRRVVVEVYDYRCAATGLRLVLPDGTAMVEAAHIHPFREAQDDDPRNGLALTPNMHWAMDKFLISPGPDFKWHVAKQLDRRIRDFEALVDLEGKEVLLPSEARMYPKRDALAWRLQRLGSRG